MFRPFALNMHRDACVVLSFVCVFCCLVRFIISCCFVHFTIFLCTMTRVGGDGGVHARALMGQRPTGVQYFRIKSYHMWVIRMHIVCIPNCLHARASTCQPYHILACHCCCVFSLSQYAWWWGWSEIMRLILCVCVCVCIIYTLYIIHIYISTKTNKCCCCWHWPNAMECGWCCCARVSYS